MLVCDVTELPPEIRQIRLPMPNNPLRHINSYLIKADDGYVLVDCGWDLPEVLDALRAALKDEGIGLDDVRRLVVTHYHSDHYGLAGRLVGLGRLRLMMHRLDWAYVRDNLSSLRDYSHQSNAWLTRNGLDESLSEADRRAFEALGRFTIVQPHEELEDAAEIGAGRYTWRVVWTPGHTPGHICLFDADRRLLISGDHVLEPITPNVSLWHSDAGNPLGDFLQSLHRVADLGADLVLPAHGEPFAGLKRRVDELLAHHYAREDAILEALDGQAITAAEVAGRIPWTRHKRSFGGLPTLQQRMALSETLSHLEELRAHARVRRVDTEDRITYTRA